MKKVILVAAMFGLAAAFTVKGADAKENWTTLCAKCHGAEGKGDTKIGAKMGVKDFSDAKVQAALTDDAAFKSLKEGLKSGDKTLSAERVRRSERGSRNTNALSKKQRLAIRRLPSPGGVPHRREACPSRRDKSRRLPVLYRTHL